MIHPTAIIHPKAQVDGTAEIGPYAIIDEAVKLGPHCQVGPHAYLTGDTEIGAHNQIHAGAVIGGAPQDLKYKGDPTRLRIGERNTFREAVTVNRSTFMEGETVIGSNNLLMATVHVGHDCVIGNQVIMANGAMLGGHVLVGDRAMISGSCLVHQFVRVGTMSMMQGGAAVSKDLPPYTVVRQGVNLLCGLNTIGLRRSGMTPEERLELKKAYHLIFRGGQKLSAAIAEGRKQFRSPAARTLLDFVESSKRGVCGVRVGESEEDTDE